MSNNLQTKISVTDEKVIVIRFAGDSGDGVQLIGNQLTSMSAMAGNDIHTISDFPAEIRAPAGTIAGVSAFQLCFAEKEVFSAGDSLDVLVALNPAALIANINDLNAGGVLIVDEDKFSNKDIAKAGLSANPLTENTFTKYKVFQIKITTLTEQAVADLDLTHASARKCKNMFALGVVANIFERNINTTIDWLKAKFSSNEVIQSANIKAFNIGFNYADTVEFLPIKTNINKASLAPGTYTRTTGNLAFVYASLVATALSKAKLFVASYPITPASDILNELVKYPDYNVTAVQLEDEIAAIAAAIGAAFGGSLALTCTSGPGLDLKTEGLGLAVSAELPLVVIDVQRAGPATGMPTKMEQSDLLSAVYGRHGEAPLVVMAAKSPADCFDTLIDAFRIAVKYMTPVIVLSDAMLANSSEPWLLPDFDKIPAIELNQVNDDGSNITQYNLSQENINKDSNNLNSHNKTSDKSCKILPYSRNPTTLARPWIIPGTPNLEHRIGGLEKEHLTGNVSYEPHNHEKMSFIRRDKILQVAEEYPVTEVVGSLGRAIVISWGSTYGVLKSAVNEILASNKQLAWIHLKYLNPLPKDLAQIIAKSKLVIVVENNLGQLSKILASEYSCKAQTINKITGRPFKISEAKQHLLELI